MTGRLGRAIVAAIAAALSAHASAYAGPADLDPGFGTGGVVIVPGTDRFDPEAAPLLGADGQITVAGLLRNASDRVFLARFGSGGATETGFGAGGEVHTNVIAAPDRRAVTTQLADGRIVVGGGSANSGRVTLERYTAAGQPDSSFGSSGKLSVLLSGAEYFKTTAAVTQPDGKVLVAGHTNYGGKYRAFVVLRFTSTGLDATFGSGGIARVAFGTRNATAWDVALLSNGKIVAAGSVGDGDATNTAIVRLNADGSLDTSFPRIETDASGASRADHATGVVADATGGFTVTGPATTTGMLARFTSTGAPDGAFGTGGVKVGGFVPAGTTFTPADLVADLEGRLVIVGSATDTSTRWAVARVRTSGANPFDATFGTDGVTQLGVCANRSGHGPTGAAVSDQGRIVVLGACNDDGRVAAVRLVGLDAFPAPATLSISATSEAAGHERIPVAGLEPPALLVEPGDASSLPLKSAPLTMLPLKSAPLKSAPLKSAPVDALLLPLKSAPLSSLLLPLKSAPIAETLLLSDLPLKSAPWDELLALEGPLQSYTLLDAYRMNPALVGTITLDQIDLSASPLRDVSLAALLLGVRPLSSLPANPDGWGGVDEDETTLLDHELSGNDTTAYLSRPLSLAPPTDLGTGDARAPLARMEIRTVELSRTPYGALPASSIGGLLKCGASCTGTVADQQKADPVGFSEATVGELIAAVPRPGGGDITLGGMLTGLIAPAEFPLEEVDKKLLLAAAELRAEDLQTYTTTFTVDCAQTAGLVAQPALPDDARLVPGSATVTLSGGTPRAVGDDLALTGVCGAGDGPTSGELRFLVEPGSELGPKSGAVTLRSGFGSVSARRSTSVDDSRDPGEGVDRARPIGTDRLLTGHVASEADVDSFTFTPSEPGRVTFTLSHLPADFDLAIYGPNDGPSSAFSLPLKSAPLKSAPLKSAPLPDTSLLPLKSAPLGSDLAADLPLKSAPLLPLKSVSINRGTAAEAVSVVVRPADVGKTHMVEVFGYNGATSEKPYVMRRIDAPAPPAPECITRSPGVGVPGTFPASVPSDRETIILVNQQRLGAREGNPVAAAQVTSRLRDLAAATKGVVVPVESDALRETGDEYVAWDNDPCNVAKANAVADAVLEVVDHVRTMGDGLPNLKHIVIAGTDEDIPMFREPDFAIVSNEFEYADESVLRNRENAISAAQRHGYVLSDDRYGDVDPGTRLSVPDVALGRLVESSADIRAQVDAFLAPATGGAIDPGDAFVTGYDFLSDGAAEVLTELTKAVPAGSASGRIDETWDAALAMSKINRSTAGLTSINAHYNHFQALPADAFNELSPNLMEAEDATTIAPRSLAFTVGCHSGLNLALTLDAPTAAESKVLGDWVQKHASRTALYAANTGFGYGDTVTVGWSERLMSDFAANLATKRMTVGQAMMFAKQKTASTLAVTDDYWNKSSMEAVFYGLPMWRVGQDGTSGATAVPAPLPEPAQVRRTAQRIDTIQPAFEVTEDAAYGRGTYWRVRGHDPLVVQNRPIQPKMTLDVTPADDAALVHGFLPDGLRSAEVALPDPVIARPTIDLAGHEPEPRADAGTTMFPSVNFDVSSQATPGGIEQRLTVVAGEYRAGVQRTFEEIDGTLLLSNSRDFQPLQIRRVEGAVIDGGLSISVDVDDTDAAGGNVLYRTDASGGTWHRVNLARIGTRRLGAGAVLPSGTKVVEAKVHVFDEAGNVSASDNKVLGYSFVPPPESSGFPRIEFDPVNDGYYESSPAITIDGGPGSAGVTYEYKLDDGDLKPYAGRIVVPEPDEGVHHILVLGSDGSRAEALFAVDSIGPTIVPSFSPLPNANGWNNGDVVVSFECGDDTSGVKRCPAPVTVTGEGADLSIEVTAEDRAGRTTSLTVDDIDIDRTKPTVRSAPDRPANADGWYGAPVTFAFACADALSGVGFCSAPKSTGTAQGTSVTVAGRGVDRADNEAPHTSAPAKVDLGDPTVTIDVPFGGVLVGQLTGVASDGLSGVKSVVVTYTSRLGAGTVKRAATLTPAPAPGDPNRVTWQAGSPGTGLWSAVATATDLAGRPKDSDAALISVN